MLKLFRHLEMICFGFASLSPVYKQILIPSYLKLELNYLLKGSIVNWEIFLTYFEELESRTTARAHRPHQRYNKGEIFLRIVLMMLQVVLLSIFL